MDNAKDFFEAINFNIQAEIFLFLLASWKPDQMANPSFDGFYFPGASEDILNLEENPENVKIVLRRQGMLRLLPPNLFIRKKPDPHLDGEIPLEEREKEDIWLADFYESQRKAGQIFFSPFDTIFFKSRSDILKSALSPLEELLKCIIDISEIQVAVNDGILNKRQEKCLYILMLNASEIATNLQLMQKCFSLIIGDQVIIKKNAPKSYSLGPEGAQVLDSMKLNVDAVLGEESYDGIPTLSISVGPLNWERLEQFIPEKEGELSSGKKVLELLCYFFVPFDYNYEITLHIEKGAVSKNFIPEGDSSTDKTSETHNRNYLGLNTYLLCPEDFLSLY